MFRRLYEPAVLNPSLDGSEHKQLRQMLRWLPAHSPIRQVGERLRAGTDIQPDVPVLVARASRPSVWGWRERVLAIWLLGRVSSPPEWDGSARSSLRKTIAYPHVQDRRSSIAATAAGLFSLVALHTAVFQGPPSVGALPGWLFGMPFSHFGWVIGALAAANVIVGNRIGSLRRHAALSLGRIGGFEDVQVLAEAACGEPERLKVTARWVLPGVMERVREEHYGRIPHGAIDALCRLLRRSNGELAVSIVRCLGRAAPGGVLPEIERCDKVWRPRAMRDAAREAIPVLRARLARETMPERLVRAADAPNAPADTLVRPAASQPVDEANLLRATVGPAEGEP